MKFEKKVEKRVNDHLNQFVNNPYEKRRMTFPLWSKIAIPSGALALTAGIVLSVFAFNPQRENDLNVLVKPNVVKVVGSEEASYRIGDKAYESYMAFARKFVPSVMAENTDGKEFDMSVSIPDAYLAIAIAGIISDPGVLPEVLSYLELGSETELKEAVHDLVTTLCVLKKDKNGRFNGGVNMNSIWFDPDQVALIKNKDEQLYEDLANVFGAAIFMEPLTTEGAMKYLEEYAIEGIPLPELELDNANQPAAAIMSSYTCVASFDDNDSHRYKKEYERGDHKMTFHAGPENKRVDYIEDKREEGCVLEGDGFHGAEMSIGGCEARFFLPDDPKASATSILDDVAGNNYDYIKKELEDGTIAYQQYELTIKAPYFQIDNKLGFDEGFEKAFPMMSEDGFATRMIRPTAHDRIRATGLSQFSKVNFDYNGFFSSSVTTIQGEACTSMPEPKPIYELTLDHPYIFEFSDYFKMADGSRKSLPMVIGRIVDPTYK